MDKASNKPMTTDAIFNLASMTKVMASVGALLQIIWRGFGIMVDDLAAAFFTLLALAIVQFAIK
jgi:phosphatidylglycerophosphatase A